MLVKKCAIILMVMSIFTNFVPVEAEEVSELEPETSEDSSSLLSEEKWSESSLLSSDTSATSESISGSDEAFSSVREDESASLPSQGVNFADFVPFGRFITYSYQSPENSMTMIVEYSMDEEGIFQVAATYEDGQVIAYVYQVKASGIYELAAFPEYYEVEDLRYSPEALDQYQSLILPNQLAIGTRYQSGYDNENQCEIVALLPTYQLGEKIYQDVLQVKVQNQNDQSISYCYYAPIYGLIAKEETGSKQELSQTLFLTAAEGQLY
ncbi:hypothetical protein [Hutsoniella sourekii]|uniref:hypothetical protein n=1 Tax=Hutsoniella sourekii TaxID=87650 RepID=UPI000481C25D|nr:hypothetical protein [Hutsoniella sourekii]